MSLPNSGKCYGIELSKWEQNVLFFKTPKFCKKLETSEPESEVCNQDSCCSDWLK